MNKKSIIIILAIMSIAFIIISLYSTFAIDEDSFKLDNSTADYNLTYSLNDNNYQEVKVNSNDELYVDLNFTNNYDSNVKYGAYYRLIEPSSVPDGLTITLSPDSANMYEEVIKPHETKIISVKITNDSKNNVTVQLGTIVGFENGDITDIIANDEILIK